MWRGAPSGREDLSTVEPRPLHLTAADRLLVVAPHPDDETLATGGLLQQAVATGAGVRVVFFTDGDNNPWAQRATEHRVFVTAEDRTRFGSRRRAEALAALALLGVPAAAVTFLGLPDQGTTDILLRGGGPALRALADIASDASPTVLVGPLLGDLHPDHSAVAVLAQLASQHLPIAIRASFAMHPSPRRCPLPPSHAVDLSPGQVTAKREAILEHRSQMFWRSAWLLSYAAARELFFPARAVAGCAPHPIRTATSGSGSLELCVVSQIRPRAFGPLRLHLLAVAADGRVCSLRTRVRAGARRIIDQTSGDSVGYAEVREEHGVTLVRIPADLVRGERLLAKLERRFGFFDEAGWIELGS